MDMATATDTTEPNREWAGGAEQAQESDTEGRILVLAGQCGRREG